MTKEERLEKEVAELKQRVDFLEKGKFVIEKAEEYKARFDAYAAQVDRLSKALDELRDGVRSHKHTPAGPPTAYGA